jgi:hypothetical protein
VYPISKSRGGMVSTSPAAAQGTIWVAAAAHIAGLPWTRPGAPDILRVFVDHGYVGYISSEWEGWHWNVIDDPWDMIKRHHQLEARMLADLLKQDQSQGR